ncbi:hypothetical protein QUC31_019375 [Theobroma cacao]|uniref:CLAVATA3/ESR (CLE)-related protein 40 n=1 Tax=Theobroma cacao TaxID=3641 RepID=A0AB32WVE3_THECC|nr:PREDICTED: CLAVATA3/ESR (CLE)-related protein 40 [Theobroma cacao]
MPRFQMSVIKSIVQKTKRLSYIFLSLFLFWHTERFLIFMPFSSMVFIRALQGILIILMVASVPFVHSSRTSNRLLGERTMAEETSTITGELESNYCFNRFGRGGSVLIVEEREVPTGPDPLHHNSNPTGP